MYRCIVCAEPVVRPARVDMISMKIELDIPSQFQVQTLSSFFLRKKNHEKSDGVFMVVSIGHFSALTGFA